MKISKVVKLYLAISSSLVLIISAEISNNSKSFRNATNLEMPIPIPEFKPLIAFTEFFKEDISAKPIDLASTTELSLQVNEPLIMAVADTNSTISSPDTTSKANTTTNILPKIILAKGYLTGKHLPKCVASEFKFNDCFPEILNVAMLYFRSNDNGLNRTTTLPALEPLAFNSSEFHYDNGAVKIDLNISEAYLHGLSDMQYGNLQFVKENQHVRVNVTASLPKLQAFGAYSGQLHIGSNWQWHLLGNFSVNITNLQLIEQLQGLIAEETAEGAPVDTNILQFNSLELQPSKIQDIKVNASGLFNDHRLNEIALSVINQYGQQIFQALTDQFPSYWSKIFLQFTNEAFRLAPFKLRTIHLSD